MSAGEDDGTSRCGRANATNSEPHGEDEAWGDSDHRDDAEEGGCRDTRGGAETGHGERPTGDSLARAPSADAQRDGFASLRELRDEIARLYPEGLTDGKQLFRVSFRVLSADEQAAAIAERKRRKAISGASAKPQA